MLSYAKKNSIIEEHPSFKIKGVETATGTLGHGLSVGCGISLANKIRNIDSNTFVLLGDGECREGSIWEAAQFAPANKLNNLFCIIDMNNIWLSNFLLKLL